MTLERLRIHEQTAGDQHLVEMSWNVYVNAIKSFDQKKYFVPFQNKTNLLC